VSDKTAAPGTASEDSGSGDGAGAPKAERRSIWTRLYHGETNFDFVGRRKLWFTLSLVAVLIGIGSLLTRGLNLGIDFEGGVVWEVPAGDASVADARNAIDEYGLANATIQELENDEGTELRIEAEPVSADTSDQVTDALAQVTGSSADDVSLTSVGPSWGREISDRQSGR
jgi:preprotein translocase subunit SecF